MNDEDDLKLYEVEVTWTVTEVVLAKDERDAECKAARGSDPLKDTCPSAAVVRPIRALAEVPKEFLKSKPLATPVDARHPLYGLTCERLFAEGAIQTPPTEEHGFKTTADLFGGQ